MEMAKPTEGCAICRPHSPWPDTFNKIQSNVSRANQGNPDAIEGEPTGKAAITSGHGGTVRDSELDLISSIFGIMTAAFENYDTSLL